MYTLGQGSGSRKNEERVMALSDRTVAASDKSNLRGDEPPGNFSNSLGRFRPATGPARGGKGLTILGVVSIVTKRLRGGDSRAERGVIGTPHADEATNPCQSGGP